MKTYDVAAYIWPSYTGSEPRTKMFWPKGIGEWQTVLEARAKFEGHMWPRKPLWGYQDEADPYVMQMQIEAATDHGVNVFIYDWYWYDNRPFLEQCLNNGFLKAKNNKKMKFYLMWANHDVNSIWDKRISTHQNIIWKGSVSRQQFELICKRNIEKYFKSDLYYKIDNKPVFMIYDIANLINGLGGEEQTFEALNWFKREVIKAGFPGLHLQLCIWGRQFIDYSGIDGGPKVIDKNTIEKMGFSSITHYQFTHFTNVARDYADILVDVKLEWDYIEKEYDIPYFPHISVGWDNNPRFIETNGGQMTGTEPSEIQKGFQMAKDFLDSHPNLTPLITINSWNEWTETSYLEPDDLYGYGYLNAVKNVFLREK